MPYVTLMNSRIPKTDVYVLRKERNSIFTLGIPNKINFCLVIPCPIGYDTGPARLPEIRQNLLI